MRMRVDRRGQPIVWVGDMKDDEGNGLGTGTNVNSCHALIRFDHNQDKHKIKRGESQFAQPLHQPMISCIHRIYKYANIYIYTYVRIQSALL